eukprot:scaffold27247_cov47-Phaeocystis_antarctica.AAC.2
MGQARLPLSPEKPDPRAKISGARELPPCTVVVAGANGRVGSRVVTELLRKHSKVNVRALVRCCVETREPGAGFGQPALSVQLLSLPQATHAPGSLGQSAGWATPWPAISALLST